MNLRVLVIGGAGVFGGRLVRALLDANRFDVVIAGRNATRLQRAVTTHATANLSSVVLDARRVTAANLAAIGAAVLIDAAGPFQDSDYRLAQVTIEAGMHYIDLADGRQFVSGFSTLDARAKSAGLVVLTGASTTPALSTAVLDHLTAGWTRVDQVEIAISPGNRAPRGLSVVRAILSYVGQPVRVFTEWRWQQRRGWSMTVRRDMPGLGMRLLSLAETPDLDIIATRYNVKYSVIFRAGLELKALHVGLIVAGIAVRLHLLRSLRPLAKPFVTLAKGMENLGSDRGGMTVEVSGTDSRGSTCRRVWNLVADSGDGPVVPTLAALCLLDKLADAHSFEPGARPCIGIIALADFEQQFSHHRIHSSTRSEAAPPSLYQTVLGDRFALLPPTIQAMHTPGWGLHASGEAKVDGPNTALAAFIAALFRFPPAAERIAVIVSVLPGSNCEIWTRNFGGRHFRSTLSQSKAPGRIIERFGPMAFDLDVTVDSGGIREMAVRRWRIGPLRMPQTLAPISLASEGVDPAGRFQFDVELSLPFGLGRLVRYRGWLVP